jgi:broad specificity phosphatase PhoE
MVTVASVYLLRHGEADYGPIRARNWPGMAADLAALTELGTAQAARAAGQLSSVGATAIVSSPMTRTLQTASFLAASLGLPVKVDFDLREWLPDDTFSWRSFEEVKVAVKDFDHYGGEWPPGQRRAWEPLSEVRERASAALTRSLSQLSSGPLIAVSHNFVIYALTGERRTGTGTFRQIEFP